MTENNNESMKTVYINGKRTKMEYGKPYFINGKIYGLCADCHQVVRMDKPILGSVHICVNN